MWARCVSRAARRPVFNSGSESSMAAVISTVSQIVMIVNSWRLPTTLTTSTACLYMFTVKRNQPGLHERIASQTWAPLPAQHTIRETAHGLITTWQMTCQKTQPGSDSPTPNRPSASPATASTDYPRNQPRERLRDHLPHPRPSHTATPCHPHPRATGPSRTDCTGSATSPTTKTAHNSAQATHPASWPPSATRHQHPPHPRRHQHNRRHPHRHAQPRTHPPTHRTLGKPWTSGPLIRREASLSAQSELALAAWRGVRAYERGYRVVLSRLAARRRRW